MRPVRRTNRQIFWVDHRAIKKVDGQIQLFPDALKENKFLPVQESKVGGKLFVAVGTKNQI